MTQTATQLNSGDHVRIADAPAGAPDPKAVVYYAYYRNLTGSVIKAYDDGAVSISIDRDSLPDAVRARHEDSERMQQERWLNSLGEEQRNLLSENEKQFSLRYTVLVDAKHVVPENAATHTKKVVATEDGSPARATSSDLDKAEEEYLRSRQS